MSKVFVIDVAKCNGCHNCQIACKDEHCEQPWLPYAEAQPLTGQFWLKVQEKERGQVPVVKLSYIPLLCNHCVDAPCMKVAPGAVYRRDDGLVIIDPVKSKGARELVASCPVDAIFYNEELDIPQKCTGCAHLLDAGWEVPRCVDACPTDALLYIDEEDIDLDETLTMSELGGCGPRTYYRNYPKRFIAGLVVDNEADEVVTGAEIMLRSADGTAQSILTDDFGDFKFEQIEAGIYEIVVKAANYMPTTLTADVTARDIYVGTVEMTYDGALTAEERSASIADNTRALMTERIEADTKRRARSKTAARTTFSIVCTECGKKFNTTIDADVVKCQFCKTDLSELVAAKKAELAR